MAGTSLLHKVAIVNDNGEVRGHLTVSVRFMLKDELDEKTNSVLVNFEGFGEVCVMTEYECVYMSSPAT